MPQPIRGKLRVVDVVFPHVVALYNDEPKFRSFVGSLSPDDSPSGRICFDDAQAAMMVKARANKNGGDPVIDNTMLGKLSTAVKYCMRRVGLSRTQRIATARNNLLGSAQPAE